LIVVGQKVFLNGPLDGTAYVSALELELGPLANLGKDLYFVGMSLNTQQGSRSTVTFVQPAWVQISQVRLVGR